MKHLFQRASSPWVRYSQYDCREAGAGNLYILPTKGAKPEIYNPLKDAERMVLDVLNIDALQMNRKGSAVVREAIMDFVGRYGLLGFLTALPTTPSFMDYEAVYLPKNHFIREESLSTQNYLALFSPLISWIFRRMERNPAGT